MTETKEINYKAIIERIVETSQEKLNDWELEFISSVYERHVLRDSELTDKQKEIVIRINHKILGGRI